MKLLALDLSTAWGTLAWFDDVVIPAVGKGTGSEPDWRYPATQIFEWPNDRKNSAQFFDTLQGTVREFGSPETIIVGLGPGSYAGTRIGISAATGLAAAGATLLGYPSVCAFEADIDDYAVIGDARRQSFFFVRVTNRRLVGNFELHDSEGLATRIQGLESDVPVFSSDSLPQFQPRVQQKFPSAEILGRLTTDTDRIFVRPPLQPIYLREANVTVPKPVLRSMH